MFNRNTWLILLVATLAAVAGGWLQHRSRLARVPANVHVAAVGDRVPDLALKDLGGREHRLSEYAGRTVLLNFWASWCGPCLDEMPALDRAAKAHPQATVIGIAMDDPQRARAFLAAHPVAYPVLLGELDAPSTSLLLGDVAEVLPYSVLIDRDGRITRLRRGPLDAEMLQDWLGGASSY